MVTRTDIENARAQLDLLYAAVKAAVAGKPTGAQVATARADWGQAKTDLQNAMNTQQPDSTIQTMEATMVTKQNAYLDLVDAQAGSQVNQALAALTTGFTTYYNTVGAYTPPT